MKPRRPARSPFSRRIERSPAPTGTALPPPAQHATGRSEGYLLMRRPIAAPVPAAPLPAGLSVGPLLAAHAAAVHRLLQQAYANGHGSVPQSTLGWWNALVADSEYDRDLAVVAHRQGAVVGFCLCWTSGFVKDLAVDAAWRHRGLGAALLAGAIAALARRGVDEVALKVDIYNAPAQRLYRRFGFAA